MCFNLLLSYSDLLREALYNSAYPEKPVNDAMSSCNTNTEKTIANNCKFNLSTAIDLLYNTNDKSKVDDETEVMKQQKSLHTAIETINNLFSTIKEKENPSFTTLHEKSSSKEMSFKEQMLKFIQDYKLDAGNAKNQYELLFILNLTLISQLIDKVDELDQIIKKL